MPWFDPRVRCNGCGAVLPEDEPPRCPACGSVLAEVGTWSELRDWAQTRRQGRVRFVLTRVMLFGLLAVAQCAIAWWRRGQSAAIDELAPAAAWPLVGLVIGLLYWRGAERDYAAWVARQRNSGTRNTPDPTSV